MQTPYEREQEFDKAEQAFSGLMDKQLLNTIDEERNVRDILV